MEEGGNAAPVFLVVIYTHAELLSRRENSAPSKHA
jgi:hypothetical protein